MRLDSILATIWNGFSVLASPFGGSGSQQPLSFSSPDTIPTRVVSTPFFASLERMARLVDIAYCVGSTGISQPFSCASRCGDFPTVTLVKTWNTGVLLSDSCGFVAVDHGLKVASEHEIAHAPEVVIAFRGTYSIANTIVDLSTVPQEYVPYPVPGDDGAPKCTNCTVHMGFFASWQNARELVLPALKDVLAKHPDYPVHLVGHSLGGSVAALAAMELKLSMGLDRVKVTTFGEPRIGNRELTAYLDDAFGLNHDDGYEPDLEKRAYRRVTHVDDPVPLLPLTEWGYRSHAGEVHIAKSALQPAPSDMRMCRGDADPACIAGAEAEGLPNALAAVLRGQEDSASVAGAKLGIPSRLQLWQLFFAHRDYFWRLGLCVPGGDPTDWGRDRYKYSDEL